MKHGMYQPSRPMPGVFSAINTRIQTPLIGQNLHTLSSALPRGVVEKQEGWVESAHIPATNVFIKGKYDLLAKGNDGQYILIDLKISQPHIAKIEKYKTQLAAYKFSLEHPARGESIKVSKLGLLIFYPDQAKFINGQVTITFPPKWLEIPIDEKGFLTFAKEVDALLSSSPPAESKDCKWCRYRHVGDEFSHDMIRT
ncbi:MAG: PD-(D/E)XK nuclease family protein [bacterium]|nr:PD-(D/E)XK nuclease family protein [bacterium]